MRDQSIITRLFVLLTDFLSRKAHDAAPFLAWHRYLIHVYENALREECQYRGYLTYVGQRKLILSHAQRRADTGTGH